MRIARALALAGIASRRKSEGHISNGAVSVNGEIIRDLGRQVDPEQDVISFRGRILEFQKPVYFLLHKPEGYVTTAFPQGSQKSVFSLLPRQLTRASRQPSAKKTRVFSVGRLDQDSSGLILFTNDGELANRLMHPRYKIPKWYEVRVNRPFEREDRKKLIGGIRLKEGLSKVEKIDQKTRRVLYVMILEGKNREIRRLFKAVDYHVTRLRRTAIGPLNLGGLILGEGRHLRPFEIKRLQEAAARL